jgi:putative hydrolase of the HAD superfamily
MNKKVIVFDMDDTLYHEIDYLISAYRQISEYLEKTYEIIGVFPFMIKKYHEKKNVFDEVNRHYFLKVPISEYLLMYRNHIPEIQLETETEKTLFILNNMENVVLGLLTDGREITQKNKIQSLDLERFIASENIIVSEKFGSEKPSVKNYLYFQQKYGSADFYYIGDNVNKDFIAPNQLNWTTVCVLDNGRNIHSQDFSLSKEYLPKYRIVNICEIMQIID